MPLNVVREEIIMYPTSHALIYVRAGETANKFSIKKVFYSKLFHLG